MPSQGKDTDRRSFVLGRDTLAAIDAFAEKHNMAESEVVEQAVLAYTGNDGSSHTDEVGPLAGKRGAQHTSGADFDPAAYDPTEDRDGYLAKSELKQLVRLDEPVINPDHVNWKNLFQDVRKNSALLSGPKHVNWNSRLQDVAKKSTLIAGVCRFENTDTITEYDIHEAITTYLGDSTYILNQYTKTVPDEFELKPALIFDSDNGQYKSRSAEYFPTDRHRREYYRDRYETIKRALSTPVSELPVFGSYTEPYEYLRQWLDLQQVRNGLHEFDIATESDIEECKAKLADYRAQIDTCLSAIDDGTHAEDFTREEAIDAIPHDQESSESIMTVLEDLGYIGDWNRSERDMGIHRKRLVWRE